jgi:uncharacterized protein (DUF305 family)
MNHVAMTNEEWQEVYRHHDELVDMARLELQAGEIREVRPAGAPPQQAMQPVELQLHELDSIIANIPH